MGVCIFVVYKLYQQRGKICGHPRDLTAGDAVGCLTSPNLRPHLTSPQANFLSRPCSIALSSLFLFRPSSRSFLTLSLSPLLLILSSLFIYRSFSFALSSLSFFTLSLSFSPYSLSSLFLTL